MTTTIIPRRYGWLTALGLGIILVTGLSLGHQEGLLPLFVGFGVVTLLGWGGVPLLRKLKAGQVIRSDGPQSHLAKGGTPTMGGVFFVPPALILPLLWVQSAPVLALSLLTLGCGLVGLLDDWKVITARPGGPRGISARLKLGLLLGISLVFAGYIYVSGNLTVLKGFQGEMFMNLGLFFLPLVLFVVSGTTNAVNITDGLDGLAAGTAAVACIAMGFLVSPGLAVGCWVMAGCCLGFLVYNHNKAQVFMGDTGSLALGGFLSGVGLLSGELLPLLLISGVFVVETFSVILQVSYFKATKGPDGKGKRLFKMAPFHHHLELSGWREVQVVSFFYGLALLLAALSLWIRLH
jgi:phospho-N-acetylmuramoyl-pentapeptide-transferase